MMTGLHKTGALSDLELTQKHSSIHNVTFNFPINRVCGGRRIPASVELNLTSQRPLPKHPSATPISTTLSIEH